MFTERIIRLVKCLAACGCLMYTANATSADAAAGSVALGFIGYSVITLWTYCDFPRFALCYSYIWNWCSIMGMFGSGMALLLLLLLTLVLLVAGVAVLPVIFLCTLLGILTNAD